MRSKSQSSGKQGVAVNRQQVAGGKSGVISTAIQAAGDKFVAVDQVSVADRRSLAYPATKKSIEWSLERYGLPVLLSIFILLGLLYDFNVPLFEKPDELKHFALIQFIETRHRLPLVEAGAYKPWDQEGTQPPLYHMLAALAVSWLDLSNFEEPPRNPHYADDRSFVWRERGNNNLYLSPPETGWWLDPVRLSARLARWLSLLAGLGTVLLTYYLSRIIFDQETGKSEKQRITSRTQLPLVAAGLVAFLPQFLHVSTAITNDSLTVTLAAAALLVLALMVKKGSSVRLAVFMGIILGLGAMTKLSLLYLTPLVGLGLLLDGWRHRAFGRFLKYGLIIAGLMLLLAGWWYGRNWLVYGDPTALNAHLLYRGGPLDPRPTLAQLWQTELVGLELSFWAAFGAGQVLLEPWLYEGFRGVKYVVAVGLVIGGWRLMRRGAGERRSRGAGERRSRGAGEQGSRGAGEQGSGGAGERRSRGEWNMPHSSLVTFSLHLALLMLWTLIIFVALLRWMQITPASWGRLLFPTLPALGILTTWALSQFYREYGLSQPTPSLPPLIHRIQSRFPQEIRPPKNIFILGRGQPLVRAPYTWHFTFHVLRFTFYVSYLLPLLLLLALFSLAVIAPFHYLQPAYARTPLIAETEVPVNINRLDLFYGDERLRLIGYRVAPDAVRPGAWLPVTLYWQATQAVDKNYSVFVHVLDNTGQALAQSNTYPDGGRWPTSQLGPGRVLADTHYIFIPPEIGAQAPLLGRLAFGIFEFDDPRRAAKMAVNARGERVEPLVTGVPILPRHWPQPEPKQPLRIDFAGQIRLIGYDWTAGQKVKPGSQVPMTYYWEVVQAPGQNLNLFIHLIEPATQRLVAGFDGPPAFPTGYWQPGYTIIDRRSLTLPADLPAGEYELRAGWYDLETLARLTTSQGDSVTLLKLWIE